MRQKRFFIFLLLIFMLAGCVKSDLSRDTIPESEEERRYKGVGKLFGEGALTFGRGMNFEDETGMGVNPYLWRGSLRALAFMPLQLADPLGGVITTSWYTSPVSPQERFKVNVVILSRELRSDGVQVSVFRQTKKAGGSWRDAPPPPQLQDHFKRVILLHARQFKAK